MSRTEPLTCLRVERSRFWIEVHFLMLYTLSSSSSVVHVRCAAEHSCVTQAMLTGHVREKQEFISYVNDTAREFQYQSCADFERRSSRFMKGEVIRS